MEGAVTLERDSEGDFSYNGDKFKTIIDRWLKENGTPSVGSRHLSALKLAADLPKKLLRDGQSFDTLTIDTKACKVTISVCKEPSRNRLKVLWT